MRKLRFLLVACLLLVAVPASAQQIVDATAIYLGPSGSAVSVLAGSGSPESAVAAPVGSLYLRTDTGSVYRKATGSGSTGWTEVGGGVSSVGFSAPSQFAVSGSPITSSGTIALSWEDQTANTLLAGPTNGSADAPTFRSMVYADLPSGSGTWSASPTISGATALSSTLAVTGVATFSDDVDPALNYTSNLGDAAKKYLTIHGAELWVQTLVAEDVMATIGGRVVVAPTTTLTAALSSGATSMQVKHDNLASGDRVRLESGGQVEWIAVTSGSSGSGPYTYSITRNLDGSGANDWVAGDALVNTGTTGDGFIDLYSTSGVLSGTGPTIVGNVRTGTTYNQVSPRWAIGNLNGLYGYASDTYGAAFGTPSGAWLKIDPTNGIRIGHDSTTKIALDASGDASFSGEITATSGAIGGWTITSGSLTSGSGSTTVGIDSGGTNPAFYAGSATPGSAPFRVTQAGALTASNATITGSITATSGDVTGAIAAGSITTAMLKIGGGGAALNDDPGTRDQSAWTAGIVTNIGDGQVGAWSLRSPTGTLAAPIGVRRIEVDQAKTYRIRFWARSGSSANGLFYGGVSLYDASGNELDQDGVGPFDGTRWFYCASAVASLSTSWTSYSCTFGAGSGVSKAFPSAARTMAPQFLLNLSGSSGWHEVQDVRIEEVLPGTLIQNGVITTSHIATNTITANNIAAGAIETSELAAGAVTAAKIGAGEITATHIEAGAITADKLDVDDISAISANLGTVTAGSITGVSISGSTITAGGGGEITIDGSGITIDSNTGPTGAARITIGGVTIYGNSGDLYVGGAIELGGNSIEGNVASFATLVASTNATFSFLGGGSDHLCHNNGEILNCGADFVPLGVATRISNETSALWAEIVALRAELAAIKHGARQ